MRHILPCLAMPWLWALWVSVVNPSAESRHGPCMRAPLEDFRRDLGFAIHSLRRSPGFAVVAVASLALGLALVASTLAVVNAYLIRSMPYPSADRLFRVTY